MNPFKLEEDELIEHMKMVFDGNDNQNDSPLPENVKYGQFIPVLIEN